MKNIIMKKKNTYIIVRIFNSEKFKEEAWHTLEQRKKIVTRM